MGWIFPGKTWIVSAVFIEKAGDVMDGLSLDQVRVFLAVAEHGSFSAAARALHRAQSAVTYVVQRLEQQTGVTLFDRAQYRPVLTDAGRALLPQARRIEEAVSGFRLQARGIAGGLEPELTLAFSSMFPMATVTAALAAFGERFPSVPPRISIESLGGVARLVLSGACALGVMVAFADATEPLTRVPLVDVELVMVAAPGHALAAIPGRLPPRALRDHVQLVLTDRTGTTGARDYGVYATQIWRIADLSAKHALLRAGLGFGSMPLHIVREDLEAGRLVRLTVSEWEGADRPPFLPMCVACRKDAPPGPAAQWMLEHLVAITHRHSGGHGPGVTSLEANPGGANPGDAARVNRL
jgi:DNA-binding transcriptional LysR family regulator